MPQPPSEASEDTMTTTPGGDGEGASGDFRGEKLSNSTHRSVTDPDARLMRKGAGKESKLVFMAHALMDNRHGLIAERETKAPIFS